MNQLTEKQAAFVDHFTATPGCVGNAAASARAAGYSENSAKEQGCRLVSLPHVRAAIDEANRQQISGALATKAVAVLDSIIDDPRSPQKLKLDAAKTVLDRAGYIAPKAPEAPEIPNRKPVSQMSAAELDAFIAEGKEKLRELKAAAAKPEEAAQDE